MARVSGTLFVKIDGVQRQAMGDWTYNLGFPKKEMVVGADEIHGYMERPQVAYAEGEIRDQSELSVGELRQITDGTITLELANGKHIVLRNCIEASDGTVGTEAANVGVRFESMAEGEESGGGAETSSEGAPGLLDNFDLGSLLNPDESITV